MRLAYRLAASGAYSWMEVTHPIRFFLATRIALAAAHRLSGESETLVVGVCSVSSGLTSELVLGMP